MAIKVRFCASPTCTSIGDDRAPECWYLLEHPFYVGEITAWRTSITSEAECAGTTQRVERCEIAGCVTGELSSYCRVDGRHLCE
jgi:hypothetical protein